MFKIISSILLALVVLSSCTKIDLKDTGAITQIVSNDLTFPVTNEFAGCKLRRIYQETGSYATTALFSYNNAGNPVSVFFTDLSAEGTWGGELNQHYFEYDSKGRLKVYRTESSAGHARHYYSYDANNRILADTAKYGYSFYDLQIDISTFVYDSQGRIVKETIRNIKNHVIDGDTNVLKPTRNPTFTYDSRGNLAVTGWKSSSYDYKHSIFRTHPVFQFIHRNYSKNNSSVQVKYNSKGLPLTVVPGNDYFFNFKSVEKAIYDCN